MLPFPSLTPLQSSLKRTRYPDATNSEVPSLFVSCSPMTSQTFAAQSLSRASMCPIPLTPLTAAVRTLNEPNVSSFSQALALAALCFLRADFLSARFPVPFSEKCPPLSLSSRHFLPWFFRCVGYGTPVLPRLLHRRHSCLLARALRAFLLSSLRVPRFPNVATAGMIGAENDFALLGCIDACRCCWQACTVSIDEYSHQSMSRENIDSCENSIDRTPGTGVVVYPRLLYTVLYSSEYSVGIQLPVITLTIFNVNLMRLCARKGL